MYHFDIGKFRIVASRPGKLSFSGGRVFRKKALVIFPDDDSYIRVRVDTGKIISGRMNGGAWPKVERISENER